MQDIDPPGAAIATFDPDGHYGNHTDGRSHAAIFLWKDPDGIHVIEQYVISGNGTTPDFRRAPNSHFLPFKNGQGKPISDGSQYHVIE